MPSNSDKDILDLFKQPDHQEEAFRMLVEKYQQRVYWIIRRMVLNHEDANDILQETFIKIWNKFSSFRGESGIYSWIYRIAINETYNFIKRKKHHRNIDDPALAEKLLENMKQDPFFDGEQARILLQRAILKLPEKQQLVFNLKYFEEMNYQEISEILKTSKGSLKASYHLAVKKIEEFLKSD